MLRRGRPRGHRVSTRSSTAAATSAPEQGAVAALRADVRDVGRARSRGLRRGRPPRRAVERPARRPRTRSSTYEINLDGTRRARRDAPKEAGVARFVFASSCSMYGASERRRRARRGRAAQAADRLRGVEGPLRGGARRTGRRRLLAGLHAQRDGLRGLAAAAARHRAEQPRRLGVHDRARSGSLSDGTPWRPIVHVARHRPRRRSRCSRLHARSCTTRRSTSAPTAENYRVRELAEIVHEALPGMRGRVRRGRRSRPAQLPRGLRPFRARLSRAPGRNGRAARRRAASLHDAYERVGLTSEDFEGSRYTRLKRLRELLDDGKLDERLRAGPAVGDDLRRDTPPRRVRDRTRAA